MLSYWTRTPLRTVALVLGAVAAVTMFYLYNPWTNPDGTARNLTTWVFWFASIGLVYRFSTAPQVLE